MKHLILRYDGGSEVKLLEGADLCPKLVSAAIELVLDIEDEYSWFTRQLMSHEFVDVDDRTFYIKEVDE